MDKQDNEVTGNDIVTILCLTVFSVLLGVLLIHWTVR